METVVIEGYEFIKYSFGRANVIFSTAKGNLNFNIDSEEGNKNIERLKEWFNLKEIGYLRQIHSDYVCSYDGMLHEGDALITEKENTAIGIFTADCVPILLYDEIKNVIAAVHSGWKGTLSGITINVLNKMEKFFGCETKDIKAFIGPHNRSCCYEIGNDLVNKFRECEIFRDTSFMSGRNLNLEVCITKQLEYEGISKENIVYSDLCTFCSDSFELYSYRKHKEQCGRMFSFIYLD